MEDRPPPSLHVARGASHLPADARAGPQRADRRSEGELSRVMVSRRLCLPTSEPPDDRRIWLTSPDSRVSSDRRLIRHGSLPSPISPLPLRITAVSEPGNGGRPSSRHRPGRPAAMHTSRAVPVRRACDAATLPNLHRQAHPLPSPTSLARARGRRSSTELARQSWCCESRQTLTRRW